MGRVEHAVNRKGWDYHSVRLGFLTLAVYLVPDPNGVRRSNRGGVPWSKGYNEMMDRCVGYDVDFASDDMADGLPCMPVNVVYGHAAARRLDINRWTFGLDTGCVSRILVSKHANSQ
jgi:hypothetical protein